MAPSATPKSRKDKSSGPSEEKYKQLKRKLKEVLEEHDRMTSRLKKARTKIMQLKREKELLLDRLERYERPSSSESDTDLTSNSSESESDVSSVPSDQSHLSPHAPQRSKGFKSQADYHAVYPPHINIQQLPSSREPTPNKAGAKRPRKEPAVKRPPVKAKLRKIQHIPVDDSGKPILPLQVGILTIYNLGEVVYDRKQFHSERYIYPVGYTITRPYASMIDPEKTVTYTCTVTDGVDGPRFHVTPEDAPEKGVTAVTATGAWTSVIRVANAVRKREHSNSASGPDYFGFSHPTVSKLIQDLPNADKCENYVWQRFEEIKGRGTKRVNPKVEKAGFALPSASPLASATPTHDLPNGHLLPAPHTHHTHASSPKISDIPDWSENGSAVIDDEKSALFYPTDTLGTSSVLSDDGVSGLGDIEDDDKGSDVLPPSVDGGEMDLDSEVDV
ncbi:hypothetical protein SpCBS45565_g07229 [Spizellomyces sp. 'palustris']|nr:hypothetical protein SpCBS45565_g07229 [Spizellomyces sp. 'palustris']